MAVTPPPGAGPPREAADGPGRHGFSGLPIRLCSAPLT